MNHLLYMNHHVQNRSEQTKDWQDHVHYKKGERIHDYRLARNCGQNNKRLISRRQRGSCERLPIAGECTIEIH